MCQARSAGHSTNPPTDSFIHTESGSRPGTLFTPVPRPQGDAHQRRRPAGLVKQLSPGVRGASTSDFPDPWSLNTFDSSAPPVAMMHTIAFVVPPELYRAPGDIRPVEPPARILPPCQPPGIISACGRYCRLLDPSNQMVVGSCHPRCLACTMPSPERASVKCVRSIPPVPATTLILEFFSSGTCRLAHGTTRSCATTRCVIRLRLLPDFRPRGGIGASGLIRCRTGWQGFEFGVSSRSAAFSHSCRRSAERRSEC